MTSQVSPGIIVKERDLTSSVVTGVQQITAALASSFRKGPIEEVVGINSQKELVDVFGKPTDGNAEDWFVASEFLQYGGRLALVRAATNVTNAGATSGVLVKNDLDFQGGTGSSQTFVARTAGTWGNSLAVVVADRGADQVVTLASAPDTTPAEGDAISFNVGGLSKEAVVYSYNSTTRELAVVLDDPTVLLTTTATLEDGNELATFTTDAAAEAVRTPGTYTPTADVNGASFQVVVASATNGEIDAAGFSFVGTTVGGTFGPAVVSASGGDGTGAAFVVERDAGGILTSVILDDGGQDYEVGNTLTLLGGLVGGVNGTDDIDITIDAGGIITFGGDVTVTKLTSGDGYNVGDEIELAGSTIGGGTKITVTVATVDPDVEITSVRDWYTSYPIGTTGLTLSAIGPRPGTSQYAQGLGIKYDELHIAVVDVDGKVSGNPGTVLERLTYLSKLSDGKGAEGDNKFYKTIVNEQSRFIYTGVTPSAGFYSDPSTAGAGENWAQDSDDVTGAMKLVAHEEGYITLSGGTDDYAYTTGEIIDAYDLFTSTEDQQVDFILMGGSMSDEAGTKAKAAKVVAIASGRQDALAFVSPHKGNQIGSGGGVLSASEQKLNTINFFSGLQSTSYAVFDSGYKYLYDRFGDKYRYIPCNGDVAGLCVATSANLDDWFSPAGLTRGSLRNAVKLAYNPGKADRDELYQSRINPITSFPGSGVTLFGDKTALAAPSAFDRINVRRLFINLRKRAESLANSVIFEQNDATTRAGFAGALNSYLSEVQARRGVTDYLVVCDESNNTPDVIDRNEFVAEVFVKPSRTINYVTVTLTATKTGVSFAEVIGTAG